MFTKDDRLKAYTTASPEAALVYASLETGRLLKKIRTEYDIQNPLFIDIVGDIILGLYPKHELISLLTSELRLSFAVAGKIASELGGLLDSLPEKVVPRIASDIAPQQIPSSSPTPSPTFPKPLTKEELMKALEAKRSMKNDIAAMREKLQAAAEPRTGYDSLPSEQ